MCDLDYTISETAWCPGCGNFSIIQSLKDALEKLGKKPHEVLIAGGIGQAAKTPQYINTNGFCGLHGRALPPAVGAKIANNKLTVIVDTGDGDSYGEGGNHFIHNIRRNVDITHFVHNNQIYGLTKGQASPTTAEGTYTTIQPYGVLQESMNPLAMAISQNCSFVARGFAGDQEYLKELMKAAITHRGFALLDILQPCVTFNKINTFKWYRDRIYKLGDDYNPYNRIKAFEKSLEWEDEIPNGIFYKYERDIFEERIPAIQEKPLVRQKFSPEDVKHEVEKFY